MPVILWLLAIGWTIGVRNPRLMTFGPVYSRSGGDDVAGDKLVEIIVALALWALFFGVCYLSKPPIDEAMPSTKTAWINFTTVCAFCAFCFLIMKLALAFAVKHT